MYISLNSSNFHFNPSKKFTQSKKKKKKEKILTSSSCWFSYKKKNEYYVQVSPERNSLEKHLKCIQCTIDFFFTLFFKLCINTRFIHLPEILSRGQITVLFCAHFFLFFFLKTVSEKPQHKILARKIFFLYTP